MKKNQKLKVIDLFAGAGLFSYAFLKERFEIILAVEIDTVATKTYRHNLGRHIIVEDIRNITPTDKCDLIIAGPPCQGFSTLGKRNPSDPRNFLSLEVIRWAKLTKPSVVIIENVGAFLDTDVWKRLVRGFRKLGYEVKGEVYNAYDFGVPQLRKRSFTVASKIGQPVIRPIIRKSIRTVREAWEGLEPVPNGLNHHYSPAPSELALARMKVVPVGGDKRDIMKNNSALSAPSWKKLGGQVSDVWGRMLWDEPANTLRTCLQNPSKGRYIHPEQNRVISLREAARLHTIPDDWDFVGTPTQIARQIGNSVPPKLGQAVARATKKLFM